MNRSLMSVAAIAALGFQTGCQQLPGTKGQQGAVIGGAGGAAAGAAIADENRLVGALIGGAAGAAGGYLIGANSDRILGKDSAGAERAISTAQSSPATSDQARSATTADINRDGFVTLDEVTAMKSAGLSDSEMLGRLRATSQVFELTATQERILREQGISQEVITEMEQINRETRDRLLNEPPSGTISRPPS
jgi:hypothetical protein